MHREFFSFLKLIFLNITGIISAKNDRLTLHMDMYACLGSDYLYALPKIKMSFPSISLLNQYKICVL